MSPTPTATHGSFGDAATLATVLRSRVVAVFVLLALGVISGPATASAATPTASGSPRATELFGRVSGTRAFIGLAVRTAADGSKSLKVYVCDGRGVGEWFVGTVIGEALDLTSGDGDSRLQGQLTDSGASGTVTLSDGRTHSFSASRARGAAGIWTLTLSRSGRFRGTSEAGGRVAGRIGYTERGAVLTGTLKLPGKRARRFRFAKRGPAPFGRYLILFSPDGTPQGSRLATSSPSDNPYSWVGIPWA